MIPPRNTETLHKTKTEKNYAKESIARDRSTEVEAASSGLSERLLLACDDAELCCTLLL